MTRVWYPKLLPAGPFRLACFVVLSWLIVNLTLFGYEFLSLPERDTTTTVPPGHWVFFKWYGVSGKTVAIGSVVHSFPPGFSNDEMLGAIRKEHPELFAAGQPPIVWDHKSKETTFYYRHFLKTKSLVGLVVVIPIVIWFSLIFVFAAIRWIAEGFRKGPSHYGATGLPYLKQGRLNDVLALIQVLALDKHPHRSEDGLKGELVSAPSSANSWAELAGEHPELFRLSESGEYPISLVSRHVSENPLGPDYTQRLTELAVVLHDRQLKTNERWTQLIPIWVAIIGGAFVLIASVVRWGIQ